MKEYNISINATNKKIDNCAISFASNKKHNLDFHILSDNTIIIGDINIHNKTDLIKKYSIEKVMGNTADNYALINHLYKLKGMHFVNELIGEFSFVLYDKIQSKLFAVRDQIGVKTLFWIKNDNGYVFASDLFLLNKYFNKQEINSDYLKEFIESTGVIDSELTPYKKVKRVSSGSLLFIKEEFCKKINYWDLSNIRGDIYYKNESDYAEEFSSLLSKAVKDRLSVQKTNAIMLSGGLDSTSIYAIAKTIERSEREYRIKSVSAVFDELIECDEREYINDLLQRYKDRGEYLNFDNILMFENFPNNFPFSYEPNVNSISYDFTYNLIKKSVESGMSNILSGYAGDHLLTGSLYVTRDFINRGKIGKAFSYITNYSISTNTSAFQNFLDYTVVPNVSKQFIKNKKSALNVALNNKMKKIKYFHQKELFYQISNAKSHLYTDRVIGAISSADIHHPFLDRRLIEYIYRIPGELRFQDNYTKFILRKSMNQYLPNKITNRINKTTHLAYTYKSLQRNWARIFKFMENPLIVEKFELVSIENWKKELENWRNGIKISDDFWTLFALELWLIQVYEKVRSY
ncbi:MAG: asparagine synthase-related protein [Bacillota bacterium]